MTNFTSSGMSAAISYQCSAGDPRVWVFQGCVCIGWLDPESKKIVPFVSEDETKAMLDAALKRKPPV